MGRDFLLNEAAINSSFAPIPKSLPKKMGRDFVCFVILLFTLPRHREGLGMGWRSTMNGDTKMIAAFYCSLNPFAKNARDLLSELDCTGIFAYTPP